MGLIVFVTTVLSGQRTPPPRSVSHPLGRMAFISSFHDFDLFYYHNQYRHHYYHCYYYHHHHFGKEILFHLLFHGCDSVKKQEERSCYFHEEKKSIFKGQSLGYRDCH